MTVMNGPEAEVRVGNCLPLSEIPVGTQIHTSSFILEKADSLYVLPETAHSSWLKKENMQH